MSFRLLISWILRGRITRRPLLFRFSVGSLRQCRRWLCAFEAEMDVHFWAQAVIILLRQLKALFRKVTALYSPSENMSTTYRNIIPTCDCK